MKGYGGFDGSDDQLFKRTFHDTNGIVSCQVEGNQFGDQRVIKDGKFISLVQMGVNPDSEASGGPEFDPLFPVTGKNVFVDPLR